MQRWHLTLGLAASAVAAAVVVPNLQGSAQLPSPVPDPVPEPVVVNVQPPVPDSPRRLAVTASLDQAALLAGSGDDRFLVVEVSADAVEGAARQPVHLSVVMDTSGSMAARGKMTHARAAAQELVGLLGPEDTFSLVTFDDRAEVRIPSRAVTDPEALKRRIGQVHTGGGTNLYDGVASGLVEVRSDPRAGIRRVVVLSDGKANIGVTDTHSLRRQAGSEVQEGVTVSAIGLGVDYNEDLLAAMADAGGGSYRFVDRPGTLTAMFTEELQQLSTVVARQTTLSLDVADGVQVREIYGYDIDTSKDGYSVFLGDLYAGQTRKLVARVHIPDDQPGTVDVVTARVSHTDAETAQAHLATADVDATITRSQTVARSSVVKDAKKQATRAQVGSIVDSAARDYAKGDIASNQASYSKAIALVHEFNDDFADADMLQQLGYIEDQKQAFAEAPPTSEAGRANIKTAKESAREYAH
jgi:Ca-activated chloride channel family protein